MKNRARQKNSLLSIFLTLSAVVGIMFTFYTTSDEISNTISNWIIEYDPRENTNPPLIKPAVVGISLALAFSAILLIMYLYNEKRDLRERIGKSPREIFLEYDQFLRSADEMKSIIYSSDKIDSRFDVLEKRIEHQVNAEGETSTTHQYSISCIKDHVHFFGVSIFTDDESDGIYGFRDMQIEIKYRDRTTKGRYTSWKKSHYIPTLDAKKTKKILIFFEEMSQDQHRQIELSYRWPGYWKHLLMRGSTVFSWENHVRSSGPATKFIYTWSFDNEFPKIIAKVSDNSDLREDRLTQRVQNGRQIVEYKITGNIEKDSVKFTI